MEVFKQAEISGSLVEGSGDRMAGGWCCRRLLMVDGKSVC